MPLGEWLDRFDPRLQVVNLVEVHCEVEDRASGVDARCRCRLATCHGVVQSLHGIGCARFQPPAAS